MASDSDAVLIYPKHLEHIDVIGQPQHLERLNQTRELRPPRRVTGDDESEIANAFNQHSVGQNSKWFLYN